MIRLMLCMVVLFFAACGNTDSAKKGERSPGLAYTKDDLKKIKWIEGKWRGIYNGQPFYETYELVNDSTLQVTSFDWNGKDSSNTSKTFVSWQEGSYYLGNEKNYKVTSISDSQIFMHANNKAANSVLWKYRTDSSWDAILEGPKATQKYLMEKFDPFTKSTTKP